jgi:peptidoglycan-N-acetylglucosamine deacetylase
MPDRGRGRPAASSVVMSRRVLLSLGAMSLTAGCTHVDGIWQPAAQPNDGPMPSDSPMQGDSHPSPGPPTPASSPSPSPTPPWTPPAMSRPAPGHCPILDGITQHPDGPQHYVPCHGTDIGLTIDDGPDPTWTPKVLALLARYHITATFCLIGRNANAYTHLVEAISDAGHEIANHTWNHPLPLTALTAAQIHDEVHRTSEVVFRTTGTAPTLFRAPGGEWSPTILAELKSAGLSPLDWSVDPRDWSRPGVPHIVDTILHRTRPGAIILEHDGGGNRQQTVDALTIVLPRLLHAGYNFVTPNHRA